MGMGLEIGIFSQDILQHYAPFVLKIKLPRVRKAREILKRDQLGRIITSKAPIISFLGK